MQEATKNIVLLNNKDETIPLIDVKDLKIASVNIGYDHHAVFDSIARKYWNVTSFIADSIRNDPGFNTLRDQLKLFNLIIIKLSANDSVDSKLLQFVKDEVENNRLIVVAQGNGRMLTSFNKIKCPLIWHQSNISEDASAAAQVIFGGVAINNRLERTYSKVYRKGGGFTTHKIRLGYSVPEAVCLNSDMLAGVDTIMNEGIKTHSTPGGVVLIAKDGQVIFHKAYGKHTYNGQETTMPGDLFDLASVTKVSATTPAIMRLYDQDLINLDSTISKYVATTRDVPDKQDILIKEALLHEAGYTPYIKFYEQLKPLDLSCDSSATYPTKVADHYFLKANYFNDVMWPVTLHSPVLTRGQFVYSDVSMYMMKEVVENVSHQKLNEYVMNNLYLPLGMQTMGFLPRNRFDRSRIVPTTENDNWFRNMLVQGYVNDPGSAMAGGVEGHAGLFSNANDLAILFQMLLNKGTYGDHRYYKEATVNMFTSRQSKVSNRGYGFDRISAKQQQEHRGYPSEQAFGHSGYTGTFVWVDPIYNLVYICLTNRVYPDDGKAFGPSKVNTRANVLDLIYRAVLTPCK